MHLRISAFNKMCLCPRAHTYYNLQFDLQVLWPPGNSYNQDYCIADLILRISLSTMSYVGIVQIIVVSLPVTWKYLL